MRPDRAAVLDYLARVVRDKIMSEPDAVAVLKRYDVGENPFPQGLPLAPGERVAGTDIATLVRQMLGEG